MQPERKQLAINYFAKKTHKTKYALKWNVSGQAFPAAKSIFWLLVVVFFLIRALSRHFAMLLLMFLLQLAATFPVSPYALSFPDNVQVSNWKIKNTNNKKYIAVYFIFTSSIRILCEWLLLLIISAGDMFWTTKINAIVL